MLGGNKTLIITIFDDDLCQLIVLKDQRFMHFNTVTFAIVYMLYLWLCFF